MTKKLCRKANISSPIEFTNRLLETIDIVSLVNLLLKKIDILDQVDHHETNTTDDTHHSSYQKRMQLKNELKTFDTKISSILKQIPGKPANSFAQGSSNTLAPKHSNLTSATLSREAPNDRRESKLREADGGRRCGIEIQRRTRFDPFEDPACGKTRSE